jgi:oligopeptide transport system substrate-binding protein
MQRSKTLRLIGAAAAVALFATACSGDDGGDGEAGGGTETEATDSGTSETGGETETDSGGGGSDAVVSTYIGEPESLTTLNTNESEGIAVLRALYTPLITYNPETSEPEQGVAESIESPDEGKTWNITLQEGWTFHDGSPVTSSSFVDAWNYGAYGPNAQQNSGFFSPIEGFEDMQCGTREATQEDVDAGTADETGAEVPDCEGSPPAAEEMSGLEVTSETEFTITLAEAQSFWETRLGYPAYSPLPEAFFEDPEGFNEAPIGNGPFQIDGSWEHDVVINTTAYSDYAGESSAQIGGIEFRIYADVNTAVTDLYAGELDIVDAVPPERWSEAQAQVPNSETSPSSSINYIGFPTYAAPFDNADMRAALSMAIDREAITSSIFEGTRQPANNLLAPVIPAYQEEVCPEWTYNPEEAVSRFEAAGGVDALGDSVTVWFNEGGGHDTWMEAVVNQWAQTLGIDPNTVSFEQLQFAEYLGLADEQGFTGPFRLGWGMDYPHPQNYLQLLLDSRYLPPTGANNTGYSNPDFDSKLDEALAIPSIDEAAPVYQEVAEIACADAPLAPMFYGLNQFAWNDGVSGVYVDAFGDLDYTALTKN